MPNQWNNPVIIADKMLEFLDGTSELINYVNTDYRPEFMATQESFGQTIYVDKPSRHTAVDGPVITEVQDISIGKMPVTIDYWKTVPVKLTGLDINFNAKDFDIWADKYLKPIVSPLANAIDVALFGLYNQIYNFTGTPGTGPTTYSVMAGAREKLTLVGNTPQDGRVCFLNPHGTNLLTNGLSSGYNPASEIGSSVMDGKAFPTAGFKIFEGNNVASHTVGTAVANTGSMRVNGANQVGSTIAMDQVTTGTTFTKGDVIQITGVYSVNPTSKQSTGLLQDFVVTATTTAAANAIAALPISPAIIPTGAFQNVSGSPAHHATVTRMTGTVSTAYVQNLAFWEKALGLVTVPVKAPEGLNGITRDYNGISVTISYGSDIFRYEQVLRADVVFGVVAFYPENAIRITN